MNATSVVLFGMPFVITIFALVGFALYRRGQVKAKQRIEKLRSELTLSLQHEQEMATKAAAEAEKQEPRAEFSEERFAEVMRRMSESLRSKEAATAAWSIPLFSESEGKRSLAVALASLCPTERMVRLDDAPNLIFSVRSYPTRAVNLKD